MGKFAFFPTFTTQLTLREFSNSISILEVINNTAIFITFTKNMKKIKKIFQN